jgi:hypothetical protein
MASGVTESENNCIEEVTDAVTFLVAIFDLSGPLYLCIVQLPKGWPPSC